MNNNVIFGAGFFIAIRALLWSTGGAMIGIAAAKGWIPKPIVEAVGATVTQENWEAIMLGVTGAVWLAGTAIWTRITNKGTVRVPIETVEQHNNPLSPLTPIPVVSPATGAVSIPQTGPAMELKPDDGHDAVMPVGLMSTSRNYTGIVMPYTLPNWKLNYAMSYIRPVWSRIPARTSNKIANAVNGGTGVTFDRQDFDGLPEDLWQQVKGYL